MNIENTIVKVGRRIHNKINPNHRGQKFTDNYLGIKISSQTRGNQIVKEHIIKGEPFMATRIGHTELSCIINYIEILEMKNQGFLSRILNRINGKSVDWEYTVVDAMHRMSGFYPSTPENLEKFVKLFIEDIKNIDIIGVWYNYYEDVICHKYCPNANLVPLESLEPYYYEEPWSECLKGKKVLVIHPFEESIRKQFLVKDLLFDDKNILPEFELRTIKAIQTAVYRTSEHESWFAALSAMQQQIDKTDFDIAIIGAGAYGLPLASYIKKIGKQAIHIGGATQILFGIMGNRWDRLPDINKFYNQYWVRPTQEETPENNKIMEGGSYW